MDNIKKRRPDSTLKKTASRVAAIQVLYSLSQNPPEDSDGIDALIINRAQEKYDVAMDKKGETEEHSVPPNPQLIRTIVEGVFFGSAEIMPILRASLPSADTFERLGPLLSAILRAGIFEMAVAKSAPYKVVIDEYTNITAAFLNDTEAELTTAVLDKIAITSGLK